MKIFLLFFLLFCESIYAQSIDLTVAKRDTFHYFSIADTAYSKYRLPEKFNKPRNWIKADESHKGALGDWYGMAYPDTFDLKDALAMIDTVTDMRVGMAKSWCLKHYAEAFPYLVARLSDKRKIGLYNTADLIIGDRIGTGDLKFYGHGGSISEDLFTVAGRASWILHEITGEEFSMVHGDLTEKQALQFKQAWIDYIAKLKN